MLRDGTFGNSGYFGCCETAERRNEKHPLGNHIGFCATGNNTSGKSEGTQEKKKP